jgi:hypothetical protein
VVVAVAAVRVVQVPGDQVVEVVRMGHGLVTAAGTVLVAAVMRTAGVVGRALFGVGGAGGQAVLVHVVAVHVMQVAVVQVIRVAFVTHGSMAAARGVGVVSVVLVLRAAHWTSPSMQVVARPLVAGDRQIPDAKRVNNAVSMR